LEGKRDITRILFSAAAFIISLVVYIMTLAPTVSFIDSGELATVCIKLGVAHPTGYPLFTILGNIFSHLPFGEPIYRLNLMCAIISAVTVMMFFNLLVFLFRDFRLPGSEVKETVVVKKVKGKIQKTQTKVKGPMPLTSMPMYLIALTASLLLGFSVTFWQSATSIEVYALHGFFLVAIVYLFLKACNSMNETHESFWQSERYWIGFAFVLGLSFTNHLSTLFLGIGTLYLYFSLNGFNKESFKRIGIMVIPFVLGLSVYSYLLIRADNPVISWGNPHNLENLFNHVRGRQFSVWMFSSFENAEKQFGHFISNLPEEFFIVTLLIAIPGLIAVYNKSKKFFIYTLLLFGFTVIYAINYDIYDINSYFLLAFIVTGIWIAFGLYYIVQRLKDNSTAYAGISLVLVAITLYFNYSKADQSDNYFVEEYTMNVFNSAPPNSIIFSVQWDFWVSASMYYQYVKGIRPDIAVIDKELLRKSWYLNYIEKHYPEIYEGCKTQFDLYKPEVIKFENNPDRYTSPKTQQDQQDLALIQKYFMDMMNCMVESNIDKRPIFATVEVEQDQNERLVPDYQRIPQGVLLRYSKDGEAPDHKEPEIKYTITQKDTYHHQFIMTMYYNALVNRASYLMSSGKLTEAEGYLNRALADFPNMPEARQLMTKLQQMKTQQNP
jgi:hypothetical protein